MQISAASPKVDELGLNLALSSLDAIRSLSPLKYIGVATLTAAAVLRLGHPARGAEFFWHESGPGLATACVTNARSFVLYTVARVERAALRRDLSLISTHAHNTVVGLATLADQAAALPKELGTPVAGTTAISS